MSATCIDLTLTCIENHASNGPSIHFLTMLFGSWVTDIYGVNSENSYSISPVMAMIGGLNIIALFYTSILVLYNGAHLTLNAAATGLAFGNMNNFILPRIGIALAGISPAIVGTYSYISSAQVVGMYVITRGTGAADLEWRLGVSSFIDYTAQNSAGNLVKDTFSTGEGILQMMTCAYYRNKYQSGSESQTLPIQYKGIYSSSYLPSVTGTANSISLDSLNRAYPQSSDSTPANQFVNDLSGATAVEILFSNSECGGVKIPVSSLPSNPTNNEKLTFYSSRLSADAILKYMSTLYISLEQILKVIDTSDISLFANAVKANEMDPNGRYAQYLSEKNIYKYISDIYNAHVNLGYCNTLIFRSVVSSDLNGWPTGSRNYCSTSSLSGTRVQTDLNVDMLSQGGWIMAARAITRMNGVSAIASEYSSFSTENMIEFSTPLQSQFCDISLWSSIMGANRAAAEYSSLEDEIDEASTCRAYWASKNLSRYIWSIMLAKTKSGEISSGSNRTNTFWDEANKAFDWRAFALTSNKVPTNNSSDSNTGSIAVGIAQSILSGLINISSTTNNLSIAIGDSNTNYNYNAALWDSSGQANAMSLLSQLGEGLKVVHAVIVAIVAGADQMSDVAANKGFITSAVLGIPMKIASMYLQPLVLSSLTGSFILANVVPIIPIVIMLFVVIAFFLTCGEALGGVTIGCALLASAAGEGLLAVHGMRMAALYGAILLRPSLHVIGLMLGYALSNLGLALLNSVWWSSLSNSNSLDIFDLALLTGGYPLVAFLILGYSFKATNLYANNLMNWVATEAVGSFGDTSEYVSSTTGAFNKLSGAFNKAFEAKNKDNDKQGHGPNEANSNNKNGENKTPPPSTTR